MNNFEELIKEAVDNNVNITLTELQTAKMARFGDFLLEENEKYNMTAIKDPAKMALLHFADSLTISELIPEGASLCDVGSGAGFPSMPLAIVRDDIRITSMDATQKKTLFIAKAAEMLCLENIRIYCGRAEETFSAAGPFSAGLRECFDVVTARAVANLGVLCELCAPAVKVGGIFVAMKGDNASEELKGYENGMKCLGISLDKVIPVTLMGNGEIFSRNIVVFKKTAHTAEKYPRLYSMIKKKPLF